ncbi:LysR family transcriptional regulator [Aureimonas glaciei]|uniref:LysR family transcriptional regulator n=1 Tax=Aureimonas glaciei TaxID=1776957 RepID=A0A916XV61_9HYPH|nr:LysR family transcriptional regulator [Aureimonas glaciei]GGD13965.1 LysR family transcriptional regulator [Aureimonas glaciei]
MLDFQLLRSFAIVARTGSISAASAQIGRTQSALSMQMRRLEATVGQKLLHRTGSGVGLTVTGERLLIHAEALLGRHDEAVSDMAGTGLRGSISFGCPEEYSIAFVPGLLKGFCADHPDVELRMVCAPTIDLRGLLHRRQLEMALVSTPDAAGGETIRSDGFVWVGNQPEPALLAQDVLPLALSAPTTLDHRAACDAMQSTGRRYRLAYASNSLAGLIAITRSGHAISVTTRAAVPGDLHILTRDLPPLPEIGIALAFASAPQSAAAHALGAHIRAVLPTL